MPISKETATDIALAYREVERGQELLDKVKEARSRHETVDVRDAFGRPQGGLQLGVPSGNSSHTLCNVPWVMAKPIIEAHITQQQSLIETLSQKALLEMQDPLRVVESDLVEEIHNV